MTERFSFTSLDYIVTYLVHRPVLVVCYMSQIVRIMSLPLSSASEETLQVHS